MAATMPKIPGAMLGRHLGKKPVDEAKRKKLLPLRPFLKFAARPVPPVSDWSAKAPRALSSMMDNDREGCCVATTIMKQGAVHAGNRPGGSEYVASDAETSRLYHDIGGPGDNGLVIIEALQFARDRGFKVGGQVHKIDGFASIEPTDLATMDAGAHWFGGLHVGVLLPRDWYNHAENGDVWDMTDSPVVGGHSIPFTARDANGFKLATWARQPRITRRAIASGRYVDECYAVLGHDWYNDAGIDTNAVNVEALKQALEAIRNGGTPDIPDDPNPPVPPPPPPPVPGGGNITLDGALKVLGQEFPIHLTGTLAAALAGLSVAGPNWWLIGGDVLDVLFAARRKDWAALMIAVEKLLTDLGVTWTAAEKMELSRALVASVETECLTRSKTLR